MNFVIFQVQSIQTAAAEFEETNANVKARAQKLAERFKRLEVAAKEVEDELVENGEVACFLRDCAEAFEWIKEKKLDLASSDSHHDEWQKETQAKHCLAL